MRKKPKVPNDPWRAFLRFFDEDSSAGSMLKKLLSHISDTQARSDFLQDIAAHVRFYILDNGELNRGRQKRKATNQQFLEDKARHLTQMAKHCRMAGWKALVESSERELADIDGMRGNSKEAFDTQRMGRGRNYLPLVVLKRIVLVNAGLELKPQELAWILEAGYCAWGREGCQDVDAETLRKALTHFAKRNPVMMAQIIERYPRPETNRDKTP